jgi:hypothetical protein
MGKEPGRASLTKAKRMVIFSKSLQVILYSEEMPSEKSGHFFALGEK